MMDTTARSEREALVGAIPALLRRMQEAGVTTLDVRAGSARLAVAASAGAASDAATSGVEGNDDAEGLYAVTSPLAGVAYFAPGPEQAVYVEVGQIVERGQVVALVEAMKVFNEIHTDRGGRVVRLGVAPGDVVSAGTPLLFLVPEEAARDEDEPV